ncbi:MAG: hypothetical protein RLZZ628_3193, partial [Bacteroidota bacterium]
MEQIFPKIADKQTRQKRQDKIAINVRHFKLFIGIIVFRQHQNPTTDQY